jgi:phenylacetate-CoA ligase
MLCGFPLGTPYFRLWGSEKDLLGQQENSGRRLLRWLLGEIPMNAFRAKEEDLVRHVETFKRYPEICHLMAYVDAAVSLAEFIEQKNLPRRRFNSIMACAGTVTEEWREVLHRVFGAEIFDKYGSRDCADIACECRGHCGLHVYSPNIYLEIVDEKNQPCPPGQEGRILITLLNNRVFPMIRYEIGDIGTWAERSPCPCGLPFPRIEGLKGRADEMLLTEDGTRLSSVFVRHFVGVSLNRQLIREWQFEQTSRLAFVFRYIPRTEAGLPENLRQIERSFKMALGNSASIQMLAVSEIPPAPSGKHRWILNSYLRAASSNN